MTQSDAAKSKAELEAELEGSSEAIQGRLEAIQHEISTTGSSVRAWLRAHPLVSVGGSLVAGAVIGWLLAGVGRNRQLNRAHRQLLNQYIDALRLEVEDAVAEGHDVGGAVQEALRNRAPLIVYEGYGQDESSAGWVRKMFGLVADTATALLVREAISGWLDDADLGDMVPQEVMSEESTQGVTEAVESSAS